jgi:hypothetical protein
MGRSDSDNEIIRRSNLVAKVQPARVLLVGLERDTAELLSEGWPTGLAQSVASNREAIEALRGVVRPRESQFTWGECNLGIGLMLARRAGKSLVIDPEMGLGDVGLVRAGTHCLVACESGNETGQVIASNLAFSIDASFLVFPELPESAQTRWLDMLYRIGSPDQDESFEEIRERAATWLPDEVKNPRYSEIIFVTNKFPWGIATPHCPTSHLFAYPDLGRTVVNGIWATQNSARSARNALLVQPDHVNGTEIDDISDRLEANGTLVIALQGNAATVSSVDTILKSLPFDVVVFSTHAGEWRGARVTYEFRDTEGRMRRLVVDEAMGFGYDPRSDSYLVQTYYHFHELDGVSWADEEGKRRLPVGTAITSWLSMPLQDRRQIVVSSTEIERVQGAMALRMHDGVWLPSGDGLSELASAAVFNNACLSFHRLASSFAFGGTRSYIGTLYPVTDVEAQEVAKAFFGDFLGNPISAALWNSQKKVYGNQPRRPYVLVGLPFCCIVKNRVNPIPYMQFTIRREIASFHEKAHHSPHEDVRRNAARLEARLIEELRAFNRRFGIS